MTHQDRCSRCAIAHSLNSLKVCVNNDRSLTPTEHPTVVSAGPASLVSTIASFPLDSIKSRLQVKSYPSAWACTKDVVSQEGIRGLFRGVTFPLITITFVRTLSFSVYTHTKELLARAWHPKRDELSDALTFGLAGGLTSGALICLLSAPFELTKVERQLEHLIWTQRQKQAGADKNAKFVQRSGWDAALGIYKQHGGVRGFYIGLRLHLLRDMTGSCLYFGFYDTLRMACDRWEPQSRKLGIPSPVVSFLIGSASGMLAWSAIYPLDLIKTQVQRDVLAGMPRKSGISVLWRLLKQRDGDQGPIKKVRSLSDLPINRFLRLYRGLGISALRSFLSHGITWMIIESITRHVDSEAVNHDLDVSYDLVDFQ